jgi:hypothetical protein
MTPTPAVPAVDGELPPGSPAEHADKIAKSEV